ncbi:MAG: PaaI family thioesterase [Gemmatimonadales bacterium]|nr:PaaI family thioesterase [Gemmatimonadales bacterium]
MVEAAANSATDQASACGRRYFGIEVPFMEYIGLDPVCLEDGRCVTTLAWQPELANSRGDIHGGTVMSAIDFTMSAAARSHDRDRLGAVTMDMTTHFYDPARSMLTIDARCIRRGRSLAFCEADVRNESGAVVVAARGIFKLIAIRGKAR